MSKKHALVSQIFMTFPMAAVMSGLMGAIHGGGFTAEWLAAWPLQFVTAWPIAFLLTLVAWPAAFCVGIGDGRMDG